MSSSPLTVPPPMPTIKKDRITEELDSLFSAGFIDGWHRAEGRWWISATHERWSYTTREITMWLNGAHAMGAW